MDWHESSGKPVPQELGDGQGTALTRYQYTAPELAHHIELSKARYIITEPEHLPQILHAADANALPHSNIFVFNPTGHLISGGLRSWEELLNHGQAQWLAFDDERRSMETPVGLFSTSGTTGLPKMAVRTHYNFVAESIALQDPVPKTYKVSWLQSAARCTSHLS